MERIKRCRALDLEMELKLNYLLIGALMTSTSYAATYECKVEKKYAADLCVIQSKEEVKKSKFKITIKEGAKVTLDRCSFAPSQNAVTCDTLEPDRVEFTNTQFVKIKKFYVTKSQYDFQIFENLTFVENNGRAGLGCSGFDEVNCSSVSTVDQINDKLHKYSSFYESLWTH